MRSFEERLAEIQRRSEAIIRERKRKRRRALLACVPLLLCVSLWGVYSLYGNGTMEASHKPLDEESFMEETVPTSLTECFLENDFSQIRRVSVRGEDWELCHEEQPEIRRITDMLTELCRKDDPTEESFTTATSSLSGKEGFQSYKIILYSQEGEALAYRLEQRLLINDTTEHCVLLTKKQETELKIILGIPNN